MGPESAVEGEEGTETSSDEAGAAEEGATEVGGAAEAVEAAEAAAPCDWSWRKMGEAEGREEKEAER